MKIITKNHNLKTLILLTGLLISLSASSANWQVVSGAERLRSAFIGTVLEEQTDRGEQRVARYYEDGTGEVIYQGISYSREWKIEGDDLICWRGDSTWQCVRFEENLDKPGEFRARNLATDEVASFTVRDKTVVPADDSSPAGGAGGAAKPSNAELAAKLANPTVPVLTIGNNFDFIFFDGDAAGADDESAFRYTFQTVFPFKLRNGNGSVFFRPAIPVFFNEPVPDGQGGFSSEGVDIGDIPFDLSWGTTTKKGLLWGGGLVGTLPTATNDKLGKDQWALGPELLLGAIGKWGVVTGILSHQWDVAGGDPGVKTNVTTLNYIYAFPLGNGWQFFSAPVITYDHERLDDKLSLPIGAGLSKTTVIRGRPWKFQAQYWNYVAGSDVFSPEHLIRFSVNPVLEAKWNRGK